GADIDVKDNKGYTALHYAVEKGSLEVVTLLLDRGADKDASNDDGWAVIHIAVERNQEEIVRLLIKRGVDVGSRIDPAGP
ncbi:ankyrin, partial [Mollisia scopiformis]